MLALVLEAMRDTGALQQVLAAAAVRQIPVVLLTAGRSAAGRALVTAHSGALAGADGAWEALADAYGVHRVADLAELTDTLELFTIGRRPPPGPRGGIATVHDSGLERAHIADLAAELGVPFGPVGAATLRRLAGVLDPGLEPGNPLDMWGASTKAQWQLTESLAALADDPAVAAVALAVDLVTEFDGDRSYQDALADAARRTSKPLAVLANIPAAVDPAVAAELRAAGIPVLEGARTGLLALGHPARPRHLVRAGRGRRRRPGPAGPLGPGAAGRAAADPGGRSRLLRDYGIAGGADAGGRQRRGGAGRGRRDRVPRGAQDRRAGRRAQVGRGRGGARHPRPRRPRRPPTRTWRRGSARGCWCARRRSRAPSCRPGSSPTPDLGPLVVVGAGGVLVEHLADRAVALPPVDAAGARRMLSRLRVARAAGRVPWPATRGPRRHRRRDHRRCPRSPASWAANWPPWTSTR